MPVKTVFYEFLFRKMGLQFFEIAAFLILKKRRGSSVKNLVVQIGLLNGNDK